MTETIADHTEGDDRANLSYDEASGYILSLSTPFGGSRSGEFDCVELSEEDDNLVTFSKETPEGQTVDTGRLYLDLAALGEVGYAIEAIADGEDPRE